MLGFIDSSDGLEEVTVRVSPKTAGEVRRLEKQDAKFLAAVDEGLEALDQGDVVSEAEMEALFDEILKET